MINKKNAADDPETAVVLLEVVLGHGAEPEPVTLLFFFSSRRRHTRSLCDWSSDVCSSDLTRTWRTGVDVASAPATDGTRASASAAPRSATHLTLGLRSPSGLARRRPRE